MICKCGARVKASADGAGINPFGRSTSLLTVLAEGNDRPWRVEPAGSGDGLRSVRDAAGSRVLNDRGAIERGDDPVWRRIAGALEQLPLLDGRRTHDGKTGQDLFPHDPEVARHQCY